MLEFGYLVLFDQIHAFLHLRNLSYPLQSIQVSVLKVKFNQNSLKFINLRKIGFQYKCSRKEQNNYLLSLACKPKWLRGIETVKFDGKTKINRVKAKQVVARALQMDFVKISGY